MGRLSRDDFVFVFKQDGPPWSSSARDTVAFLERQTRCRLSPCVRLRGAHVEHEF